MILIELKGEREKTKIYFSLLNPFERWEIKSELPGTGKRKTGQFDCNERREKGKDVFSPKVT